MRGRARGLKSAIFAGQPPRGSIEGLHRAARPCAMNGAAIGRGTAKPSAVRSAAEFLSGSGVEKDERTAEIVIPDGDLGLIWAPDGTIRLKDLHSTSRVPSTVSSTGVDQLWGPITAMSPSELTTSACPSEGQEFVSAAIHSMCVFALNRDRRASARTRAT